MPQCEECKTKTGLFTFTKNHGLCDDCARLKNQSAFARSAGEAFHRAEKDRQAAEATERAAIDTILLTTETAPNLPIAERIEIVTAECAFGMNMFKDLFAGVRDIVGGRSKAVQATMRDARRTALFELKREAWLVGADAVVGVDLDYVELSSAGSMVMLVASGTAVRLAPPQ